MSCTAAIAKKSTEITINIPENIFDNIFFSISINLFSIVVMNSLMKSPVKTLNTSTIAGKKFDPFIFSKKLSFFVSLFFFVSMCYFMTIILFIYFLK